MSDDNRTGNVIRLVGDKRAERKSPAWTNPGYAEEDERCVTLSLWDLVPYMLRITGRQWPCWLGGFEGWCRACPPEGNVLAFRERVNELRHATMLEF